MGVQNQIYAHKIKLVGGTKRVVEKSRILQKNCEKKLEMSQRQSIKYK